MGTVKGGRGKRDASVHLSARAHGGANMIGTNNDVGCDRDGGFEFDAEGDDFGFGIMCFHLWI